MCLQFAILHRYLGGRTRSSLFRQTVCFGKWPMRTITELFLVITARVIWQYACVRQWPYRGLVFECVTCFYCFYQLHNRWLTNRFLHVNGKRPFISTVVKYRKLSYLLPSEIRVIPCVVSKHFDGLVSFHSSIVQACVYNQPHCTPNLERKKVSSSRS